MYYVFQLYILARDNAIQPKSDVTLVRVRIQRNEHAPVFNPTTYSKVIFEDLDINSQIVTVTATDDDRNIPLNANVSFLKGVYLPRS